jgi:hypothetical protein
MSALDASRSMVVLNSFANSTVKEIDRGKEREKISEMEKGRKIERTNHI